MACFPADAGDGAEKRAREGCGSGWRLERYHDSDGMLPAARRRNITFCCRVQEAEAGFGRSSGDTNLTRAETHTGLQLGKARDRESDAALSVAPPGLDPEALARAPKDETTQKNGRAFCGRIAPPGLEPGLS
jgi:hypothetical protein